MPRSAPRSNGLGYGRSVANVAMVLRHTSTKNGVLMEKLWMTAKRFRRMPDWTTGILEILSFGHDDIIPDRGDTLFRVLDCLGEKYPRVMIEAGNSWPCR